MNSQPYGISKQLYRTSYSPSIQTVRPSSINTPIYTQNHVSSSPMVRFENSGSSSSIREVSKANMSLNQSTHLESNKKIANKDYYPQPKQEDMMRFLQQKVDQMSKKVTRNCEDIKLLRQVSKNQENSIKDLSQELKSFNKRQESSHQDCLTQIQIVKLLFTDNQGKIKELQVQSRDKTSPKMDEKDLIKIKSLVEDRVKQETTKIKLIIDNQISKINHELKWEVEKNKTEASPFRSKLKYPFKSIKLVYSQFLQTNSKSKASSRLSTRQSLESPRSEKVLMKNEQVYFIDCQGFLLDENSFYILDSNQKMIRLSSKMLQQLREQGLLSQK